MSGVAPLTKEQAIEWGVVGPVVRASGVDTDVRNDHPYLAHQELGFKIVTQQEGDVRARVVVRAIELLEIIRVITDALRNLPSSPVRALRGVPNMRQGKRLHSPRRRGEVI